MKDTKNDQCFPDGTCHGRDLPDKGVSTGLSDDYGAGKNGLERGFVDRQGIGSATKSDR